ncbi:hypothetical protein Fmac_020790 [Flemingia macrophylla]|uniref:Uncharacterized protein n=1 Tax=Flemingia macrophylla TaxID=520843 RepID=A0ABD1LVK2_9FABA
MLNHLYSIKSKSCSNISSQQSKQSDNNTALEILLHQVSELHKYVTMTIDKAANTQISISISNTKINTMKFYKRIAYSCLEQ